MAKPHASSACTPDSVRSLCAASGFSPDAAQVDALAAYLGLLVKWNKVMNLVGRATWEDIFCTLVADSFHLADFLRSLPLPDEPECRDLGAGAGLPGLPLRMLWQHGRYTLVEAREKRAIFLRTCLAALPLPGVTVFHGRAETYMASAPPAHLTVSRAFLPWEQVLSLVEPHTDSGGFCVFLTLAPLPSHTPDAWAPFGGTQYFASAAPRYFWALQKK